MSDEPFRFAIPPHEKNARKVVRILVQHGALTSEDLRQKFEQQTSLRNQSFYNALKHCKKQGWFIGGGYGRPYTLSPDGSWKEPDIASIGETIGVSRDKDQLEYLVDSQTQQIGELQSEVERLRDWSSDNNNDAANIALGSLIKIVSDNTATPRQRIKACAAVLGYRVHDDSAIEFVKRFLQSVCASADVATDHRIEASELLRKHEAPRVASESVRPDYCDGDEAAKWSEALAVVKRRAVIHGHSFVPTNKQPRVQHTDLASALREARLRVFAKARAQAGLPVDEASPADDDD